MKRGELSRSSNNLLGGKILADIVAEEAAAPNFGGYAGNGVENVGESDNNKKSRLTYMSRLGISSKSMSQLKSLI